MATVGPSMPRLPRGLTLIELVIVIVVLAILGAIVLPRLMSTRDKAHTAAMRSDLAHLAVAEQEFMNEKGAYTSDLAELDVTLSPGVRLVGPIVATASGWAAKVEHPQGNPRTCAIFVGDTAPVGPAAAPGVVACGN